MIDQILECAKTAALKAGEILREGYGTNFKISSKSARNDLVTEYDLKAEKAIIEYIKSVFPESAFLAEESGKSGVPEKGQVRWIIDPLDGTVNFAHALPIFCVSIAAELDGEIVCGVIYQPVNNELFYAAKGQGAFLNGEPIHVSSCDDIKGGFLVTGFPYNVSDNPDNCVEVFINIIRSGIPVRRLGSAAMDLAYVSCGRFDGFWEVELNPWDVAAGWILVQEAGGKVSNFDLSPYTIGSETILATNGLIHESASSMITNCCKI